MDELHPSGFGAGLIEPVGVASATKVTRAVKIEVDHEIRCQGNVPIRTRHGEVKLCGKLLIEQAGRPWRVTCPRCGTVNQSPSPGSPPA